MKYPEVITNLNFVIILTISLESRTGKSLQNNDNSTNNNFTRSDANVTNNSKKIVRYPNEFLQSLFTNIQFAESQYLKHEYMQLFKTYRKLDIIARFSLRPPELIKIVMVGKYYQWFNISSKPLKHNVVLEFIDEDITKSTWVDAMKCQILILDDIGH